ncbi:MAG: 3'-5' exonuclease [Smithella sp.]
MHLMLDLETLGSNSNAAILSIGAVAFNPRVKNTYEDLNQNPYIFYRTICIESAMRYGRADASTIQWWMNQSDNAKKAAFNGSYELPQALDDFAEFCKKMEITRIWGNGATFDNVIIRNAWDRVSQLKQVAPEFPIPFWGDECYRTIKELVPQVKIVRYGTYHNALDDAISQALHLQQVMEAIKS